MNKTIIFRIQDKDGRGPYRPGLTKTWIEDRKDHDNLVPWFVEFGPVHEQILYGEHAGCGCLTVEALRRWFTITEYRRLLKLGYRAVAMEANRLIARSPVQCVFGRAKPLNEDITVFELYEV
jgi:hypothetical protein